MMREISGIDEMEAELQKQLKIQKGNHCTWR